MPRPPIRPAALAAVLAFAAAAPALAAEPGRVTLAAELPTIDTRFDRWDVCQQVEDWIEKTGALSAVLPRLCGEEMTQSFGVAAAAVTIAGRLDELVVHDGYVRVEGAVDTSVTMTPPRLEGGRAPAFSPCDRGDFEGCYAPPSGERFAEFLTSVAPGVELGVPKPPRVCAPGTPIVTRAGYRKPGRWIPGRFTGSGWNRRWIAPRYVRGALVPPKLELCEVSDFGELPEVVPPEVDEIVIDAYPHIIADMGITASGAGQIEIEIPIPYAGARAGYGNKWIDLNLMGGVSLVLTLRVDNAGADAYLAFDQDLHIRSRYTEKKGWTQEATVLSGTMAPDLLPHSADVTVRAAVKLGLEATAKVKLGAGGDSSKNSSRTNDESGTETDTDAGTADPDAHTDSDQNTDTNQSKACSEHKTGTDPQSCTENDTTPDEPEDTDSIESPKIALPPLPVEDPVQCAANWAAGDRSLDIGFEAKANVLLFVEGTRPLFGDADAPFVIDAGGEFSHAESLSLPAMCEIGCEHVAGEGSIACSPVELFHHNIAELEL